jgi:hypothetical protein
MAAAVALGKHLAHHRIERYSLGQIVTRGPMRRGHVVRWPRVIQHADGAGFLPVRLMDAAGNAALQEEKVDPFFILADQDHRFIKTQRFAFLGQRKRAWPGP